MAKALGDPGSGARRELSDAWKRCNFRVVVDTELRWRTVTAKGDVNISDPFAVSDL